MGAAFKLCICCRIEKPLSDFPLRSDTKRPMGNCRLCFAVKRAAFDRKQYAKKRAALVAAKNRTDVPLNNAFNLWHHPVNRSEPLRPRP